MNIYPGELGVRLSKDLTSVAASALQKNMTLLGPLVLPFSEKFIFAINLIRRKLLGNKKLKPYTPDFSLAFDHICIHSGEWLCWLGACGRSGFAGGRGMG